MRARSIIAITRHAVQRQQDRFSSPQTAEHPRLPGLGAADQGSQIYRTFTSREVWTPWAFFILYVIATAIEVIILSGVWTPT